MNPKLNSPELSIAAGVLSISALLLVSYLTGPQYFYAEHPIAALAIWTPLGGFISAAIFKLFHEPALPGFILGCIMQSLFVATMPCIY